MKTDYLIRTLTGVILVAGLVLSACHKDKDEDINTDNLKQTSKDQLALKAADDMATSDVSQVLGGGGSKAILWVPCNATLDSSFVIADTATYIITYNGLNCEGNYYRQGVIEAHKSVNDHWADAGAVVYIKYINFKITRVSDSRWVMVNGVKRFTNVTGGRISDLGVSMTSITHRVRGSLSATFDDNTTRNWYIAREKVFTGASGSLIRTVSGLGTADGYNNLESWGVNRHGDNYYNSVTTAVAFKESCSWNPEAGSGVIYIPAEEISATLTFGYDASYQLVNINGTTCAAYYKVDWVKGDHNGSFYVAL
jgi:hypothetical protein